MKQDTYSRFFTARGAEIAKSRQAAAVSFYEDILREVSEPYGYGKEYLKKVVQGTQGGISL